MKLNLPVPLALGRFKQLPQRTHEVWQGGLVRLPMWIDHPTDPEGEPYRPTGAVWVSTRTGLMHLALPPEGGAPTPEFALTAMIEVGLKRAKGLEGRPARVEVRDAALGDALGASLAVLSTTVAVVDDLPAVGKVMERLEADASGGRRLAGLLEAPGMTLERVRAFADAAMLFYRARVWEHLANEDLVVVESDATPRSMRHVSVLGQGGQQFGLAFFESRAAFDRVLNRAGAGRHMNRAHGVTFGPIDELPFADVDACEEHALPVAGRFA